MPASVSVGKLLAAVMVLIQPLLAAEPPRFEITEAPSLPLGMAGHAGGVVQGFPIVAGGSRWDGEGEAKTKRRLHESFVLRHDRWEPGPPLPGSVSEVAYASDGTGLYIAGGTNGSQALREVWHLSSVEPGATWRGLTPLPEVIEAASGAILNETFYVCGGLSEGKPSARLWGLNLKDARPEWRRLADLPAAGRCCSACLPVNGRLFLFGGFEYPPFSERAQIFGDAYCYTPASNQDGESADKAGPGAWEKIAGLDFPGYAWSAIPIDNRQILFAGRVSTLSQVTDQVWLLDLVTLATSPAGHLPYPTCCVPAIALPSGVWLLPGGEPDTNRNRTDRVSRITLRQP